MPKKSNWELLKAKDEADTPRYRDVYDDQQLERSRIEEKQSPVSRIVLTVLAGVFVAVIVYFVGCAVEAMSHQFSQLSAGVGVSSVSSEQVVSSEPVDNGPKFDPEDESTYYLATKDDWIALKGFKSVTTEAGERWQDSEGNQIPFTGLDAAYAEWLKSVSPEPESGVELSSTAPSQAPEEGAGTVENPLAIDFTDYLAPSLLKVGIALLVGLMVISILYPVMMRNLEAQNLMSDVIDINQYPNDQHVALPEEVQRKFDWFPDVGAHCPVQVSSMISHVALSNKGLKTVEMVKRAEKDIVDKDGNVLYLKGEMLLDDDGNPIMETVPLIDEKFMNDLFNASGAPKRKKFRRKFDTTTIEYNIGNENRGKVKDCDYVSDMINKTWTLPLYEPQRPGGAYLVDTEPVNTMV